MSLACLLLSSGHELEGPVVPSTRDGLIIVAASGAPATPDADDARSAAAEELSRRVYRDDPSALSLLWGWIKEHLDPAHLIPGAPVWVSWLIVGAALVAIIVTLTRLARRVTRVGRKRHRGLFDDVRDAAALVLAANDAAERGDWTQAVVERFRAIIRSLDERSLIEDYPGMTAHEASSLAARALVTSSGQEDSAGNVTADAQQAQALTQDLVRAAALFDGVRYGRVVSSSEQDEWMRALAERVAGAPVGTGRSRRPA